MPIDFVLETNDFVETSDEVDEREKVYSVNGRMTRGSDRLYHGESLYGTHFQLTADGKEILIELQNTGSYLDAIMPREEMIQIAKKICEYYGVEVVKQTQTIVSYEVVGE